MYCNKCMNEIREGTFCRECMTENVNNSLSHHLKPGTVLNRKYIVGSAIGEGGFGITYVGRDTTLDIKVAIKEYYPNGYVTRSQERSNTISTTTEKQIDFFRKGKERFLMEARSLAKFNQEKGVVDIRDYFEENGTAYIIMEYLDGINLSDYIKQRGIMDATSVFSLMKPVMQSLQKIHEEGIIHRDISPDNIMFLRNGTLKLMDFGAARYFLNQNTLMSVVLKMGYAPEEQYRKNGHQGPWTDVYGICATMYRCITGKVPEEALDRLHVDNIKTPSQLGIPIPKPLEAILMYGLAVHKENRYHSMTDLISNIDKAMGISATPQTSANPQKDIYNSQAANNDNLKTRMTDCIYDKNNPYPQQNHNYKSLNPANRNVISQQRDYSNPSPYNMAGIHRPEEAYGKHQGYQSAGYNNRNAFTPPNNLSTNNQNDTPKSKNYTSLIIIISACLVVVIAIAIIIAVTLSGSPTTGKNKNVYSNIPSYTQATTVTNKDILMINCLNDNYQNAVNKLEDMGLTVKTEFRFDEYYEKDKVCSQSISTGKSLKKGDTVTLYVSKGSQESPYSYKQKVVVTAPSGSAKGKLKLYNWANGTWEEKFSCTATVGKQGISGNYGEGIAATPKGTFKLGYLIAPSNMASANWPYYKSSKNTCIIDDSGSKLYNQIKEISNVPSGVSYDNIGKHLSNGTSCGVLFIEHNGNGTSSNGVVRGNGSAITICGINNTLSATYGCIDISSEDFYTLMSKLDYSKNPHIELKN